MSCETQTGEGVMDQRFGCVLSVCDGNRSPLWVFPPVRCHICSGSPQVLLPPTQSEHSTSTRTRTRTRTPSPVWTWNR